jgi:TonB family protein
MSGESVLAFLKNPKRTPLEEQLGVESDKRLFGCMGSGSVFGIAFAVFALSIHVDVYKDVFWEPKPEDPGNHPHARILIPDESYHGPIKKRKIAKIHPKPGEPGSRAAKPKAVKPSDNPGNLTAKVITSKRGLAGLSAYDFIPKAVKNIDLDKLSEFATLTRTSASRIGGRPGKQSNEYNEGYNANGTGGDGRGIELPGWEKAEIPTEVKRPNKIGDPIEIDKFSATTTRSTASILAVIRSHSPGLRHVYNSFLKMRPGLAGKITLRFAIAPSGQVVDVGLAGSTTAAPEFDAQVVRKVMAWRFDAVKAVGNDIVTVPFNFSE